MYKFPRTLVGLEQHICELEPESSFLNERCWKLKVIS